MTAADFSNQCRLGESDAHLLSTCVLKFSSARSKEQAAASAAKSVSDLVRRYEDRSCGDLLGAYNILAYEEAPYMATLVQALPPTGSCAVSCPLSRPLCNGTLGCVRPTCADVKPLCNRGTDAGALARLLCGVTCGCVVFASELLWIGLDSGCLPQSQENAKAVAESASCSDAQPGSAELAALFEYSRAFELQFTGASHTNATVRAELGCFALNFENTYRGGLCDQEYWNSTYGAKSLVPFCPVSCGCIGNPSKPGCPSACRAPEPPTLRDLSAAQLAVANAAMATWNKPYPPSCFGLNATVCDALLTVWYKHPCPLACGMDPDAASASAAPHQPTTRTA
jgi:hypothetical protein